MGNEKSLNTEQIATVVTAVACLFVASIIGAGMASGWTPTFTFGFALWGGCQAILPTGMVLLFCAYIPDGYRVAANAFVIILSSVITGIAMYVTVGSFGA